MFFNFSAQKKSVLEFFGCSKPRYNQLEQSIRDKISSYDLGQWSVQPIDTTTAQPQNKALNRVSYQIRPTVRPIPVSEQTRPTTPYSQMTAQTWDQWSNPRINYKIDERNDRRSEPQFKRTEYKERTTTKSITTTEQRRRYLMTHTPRQTSVSYTYPTADPLIKTNQSIYKNVEQRTDQRSDQIIDKTAHVIRTSTLRVPLQPGGARPLTSPLPDNKSSWQTPEQFTTKKEPDITKEINMTLVNVESARAKKYRLKISGFWKIAPIVVMVSLFLIAVLVFMVGLLAVFSEF